MKNSGKISVSWPFSVDSRQTTLASPALCMVGPRGKSPPEDGGGAEDGAITGLVVEGDASKSDLKQRGASLTFSVIIRATNNSLETIIGSFPRLTSL